MVQINLPHDNTQKYLNVKALCITLRCDPDLAPLPRDKIQLIFQMLYIYTGCDYTSFFKGLFTLPCYLMRINAHHQVQLNNAH